MSAVWQVQEAKNRFGELIDKANSEGEQIVTRHGRPVAKIIPFNPQPVPPAAPPQVRTGQDVLDFLQTCPVDLTELIRRDRSDLGRSVSL